MAPTYRQEPLRRVAVSVALLDVALILTFVAMQALDYETFEEWWAAKVVGYTFSTSFFDLLVLSFARGMLVAFFAFELRVIGNAALVGSLCLATGALAVVKAIVLAEYPSWAAYAVVGAAFILPLLELSLVLLEGTRFCQEVIAHDEEGDVGARPRRLTVTAGGAATAESAPLLADPSATSSYYFRGDEDGFSDAESYKDDGDDDAAATSTVYGTPPSTFGSPAAATVYGTPRSSFGSPAPSDAAGGALTSTLRLHAPLQSAVRAMWNNEFEPSEAMLSECAEWSPRHALHLAEVQLLRQAITGRVTDRDVVLRFLDKADALIDAVQRDGGRMDAVAARLGVSLVDDYAADMMRLDIAIAAADATLWRAMTQVSMGMQLRGAFNLRKSWKLYSALLQQTGIDDARASQPPLDDDVRHAILFGVGFFYFVVSIAPGATLSILEAIGFVANRDLGVRYLTAVHEYGGVRAPMAAAILLANHLFIPRAFANVHDILDQARPIIEGMLKQFPEGTLFLLMASHFSRKTGQVDRAIEQLQRAIDNTKRTGMPPNMFVFELGCCYFMNLQWAAAMDVFRPLCDDTANQFETKPFCAMQLSGCLAMLGREEEARTLVRNVRSFVANKSNRFVKMAIAKADRMMARGGRAPFLAFEFLYLRRDLAHMRGQKLDEAREMVERVYERLAEDAYDDIGIYLLLMGAMLKGAGDMTRAMALFDRLMEMDALIANERYTIPFALYEMAECHFAAGDLSKAEEALSRAAAFKGDYDFSDVLRNRIRLAQSQLKKLRAE